MHVEYHKDGSKMRSGWFERGKQVKEWTGANGSRTTSSHDVRMSQRRSVGSVKMTPMEFVATWRMQLAAGMLIDANTNMLDVAMKCGYESEAAFRKAFKRIMGFAPGKARSAAQSAVDMPLSRP